MSATYHTVEHSWEIVTEEGFIIGNVWHNANGTYYATGGKGGTTHATLDEGTAWLIEQHEAHDA